MLQELEGKFAYVCAMYTSHFQMYKGIELRGTK